MRHLLMNNSRNISNALIMGPWDAVTHTQYYTCIIQVQRYAAVKTI